MWTAIAVTFQQKGSSALFQNELDILKRNGLVPNWVPFLAVEDSSTCLGSGGSSLNALLILTEHICAQKNFTVLRPEVINESHFLIINSGRILSNDPRGYAFVGLNCTFESKNGHEIFVNNLVHTYLTMTELVFGDLKRKSDFYPKIPPGVWLCGTNSCVVFEPGSKSIDWLKLSKSHFDILALSIPVSSEYGKQHGVYRMGKDNELLDIIYQGNRNEIDFCKLSIHNGDDSSKVPLSLTIIFFTTKVAESFLRLHSVYPLNFATYLGEDSNNLSFKMSIYFDFLLATCQKITEEEFVEGLKTSPEKLGMPGCPSKSGDHCESRENFKKFLKLAHRHIWQTFNKFHTKIVMIDCKFYHYFLGEQEDMLNFRQSFAEILKNSEKYQYNDCLDKSQEKHGDNSFVNGLSNGINNHCVEENILDDKNLKGEPFIKLQALFNDHRKLICQDRFNRIKNILFNNKPVCLLPIFRSLCSEGYSSALFNLLDSVAEKTLSNNLVVAARTFFCIADCLAILSHNQGGLRSGPGLHHDWNIASKQIEIGNAGFAIEHLKKLRNQWSDTPFRMVRAARHFEAISQIILRKIVSTVKNHVNLGKPNFLPVEMDKFCTVETTARIDFSGGWSDTPPITNEIGGAVVTGSLLVDGKRPIGCKTRRIVEPILLIRSSTSVIIDWRNNSAGGWELLVTSFDQLARPDDPNNPMAFVCAVLTCAGIIQDYNEEKTSLADHLLQKFNGGFEIYFWSNLPQGSGLGTSSILAGCMLMSIWRCLGHKVETKSVVHAVLYVEQLLTTGGGWQDQVGGLCEGGIKMGTFHNGEILMEKLSISRQALQFINDRLLLIFTGKTRLAKNLLQEVVRNWHAREPNIVAVFYDLVQNARDCKVALETENWPALIRCLQKCVKQKSALAAGSLPEGTENLLDLLIRENLIFVGWPAGAGGGGFVYLLMKNADCKVSIGKILASNQEWSSMTVHEAEITDEAVSYYEQ